MKRIRALWALFKDGYLREQGWFRSFVEGRAIDAHGEPVPWMNYAVIDFLKERLRPEMNLLEFGSGGSTLFFAKRCARVGSREADRNWYERLRKEVPDNVELFWRAGDAFYDRNDAWGKFDVVVIDTMERNRLAEVAISYCSQTGVIIWDDTERPEYLPGVEMLLKAGWRQLRFCGIGPIQNASKETSIFYRRENVLGI